MSELTSRSKNFITQALKKGLFSFDTEHLGSLKWREEGFKLHGCSFATELDNGEIGAYYETDLTQVGLVVRALFPHIKATGHNAKYDIITLSCDPTVKLQPDEYPAHFRDTLIAQNVCFDYLRENELGLKILVKRNFGHIMEDYLTASNQGVDLDTERFHNYAKADAYWQLKLWLHTEPLLIQDNLLNYFTNILMPASNAFADIDMTGMNYDIDVCLRQAHAFSELRDDLEEKIYSKIGRVNLTSPKAVAKRLFSDLGYSIAGLPLTNGGKKKKANGIPLTYSDVSTKDAAIDKLAKKYPAVKLITYHRTCEKQVSAYLEPAITQVANNKSGRIHGDSNFVTATGRMSARNFPLQTVPTFLGEYSDPKNPFTKLKIREGFTVEEDWEMYVSDFSQIELRFAGLVYNDKVFLDAYRNYKCTACGKEGVSDVILHACPHCDIPEDEDAMKGKVKGFWHGLDLHTDITKEIPALDGDRSAGKICVHEFTRIRTAEGEYKRIKDLSLKESSVYSSNGAAPLGAVIDQGIQNTVAVISKHGILRCTPDHPIQLQDLTWRAAQDLEPGDILRQVDTPVWVDRPNEYVPYNPFNKKKPRMPLCKVELDERWAYFAGLWYGDGSMNSNALTISFGGYQKKDKDWGQALIAFLTDMGLHFTYQLGGIKKAGSINLGSKVFLRFCMDQLGFTRKGPNTEIHIPDWVWNNKKVALAFLAGLFDTDGYIASSRGQGGQAIEIVSKYFEFSGEVCQLLRSLGYDRTFCSSAYNKGYDKHYGRLSIDRRALVAMGEYMRHPFKLERIKALEPYKSHLIKPIHNEVRRVLDQLPARVFDLSILSNHHSYDTNGMVSHNCNFSLIFNATAWTMHSYYPKFSPDRWEDIIAGFFRLHPETKRYHRYIERVVDTTREVTNMFGRKRRITKEQAQKHRKHCINQLVNFPVQSPPASLMQMVVTKLRRKWIKEGIWMTSVKIVNVIHDEIVVVYRKGLDKRITGDVKYAMEHSFPLKMPIRAEGKIVQNWAQAK